MLFLVLICCLVVVCFEGRSSFEKLATFNYKTFFLSFVVYEFCTSVNTKFAEN